jgi:hypothetical protein
MKVASLEGRTEPYPFYQSFYRFKMNFLTYRNLPIREPGESTIERIYHTRPNGKVSNPKEIIAIFHAKYLTYRLANSKIPV